MKKNLPIIALLLTFSSANFVFAAEKEETNSLQISMKMPPENTLVDISQMVDLNACGDFGCLPREHIVGIISTAPIAIRAVNKAFYFLSSGYTTLDAIGLDTPPFKTGYYLGNPKWSVAFSFKTSDMDDMPSPLWFVLTKRVYDMPPSRMDKLKGSQVRQLLLWQNGIGAEGVKSLILQGTQVQYLDLRSNRIGAEGVKNLKLQDTQVQQLKLGDNQIGDEGVKSLILQGTQVQHLDLYSNQIGDEGIKGLNLQGSQVQHLDLNHNQIGDKGLKNFKLQDTQVQHLDLSYNQIGDEGLKNLKLQDTQVQHLNLSRNQIGDEGVKNLNLHGTQVKTIDLDSLRLSGETMMFLRLEYPHITFKI